MQQESRVATRKALVCGLMFAALPVSLLGDGRQVFAAQNTATIPKDLDTIMLSRSSEVRGKESDLTVMWKECTDKKSFKESDKAAPNNKNADIKSDGRGITLTVTQRAQCVMVVHVSIDADAPTGPVFLRVTQNGELTGMAPFEILAAAVGPIPTGLESQVDVMWKVVPHKTVRDSFGHRVAYYFYCVELVIGNDSGSDLQLASVGFRLPARDGIDHIIPANGYQITRGTLLWGQQITPKNLVLNSLKAVGPVLTGLTPFFRNVSHRANYSTIVDVISNPIEKGVDLALPDPTIGQLNRLDDATLRDNIIVPNNTQLRTLLFISKASVPPFKAAGKDDSKDSQDISKGKAARDEHEAVRAMRSLGELVLIGKNIQYLNRIHITSTPAVGVPSATSVTPDTVTRGKRQELIIAGSLLQDAKVTGPTGFTITKVKPDDKGTSISLTLETDSSVPLGVNLLTVSTPGGSTIAKVTVAAPASPDNCQDVKAGEPCLNTAEPHEGRQGETLSAVFTGVNLKGVRSIVCFEGEGDNTKVENINASPDKLKCDDRQCVSDVEIGKNAKIGNHVWAIGPDEKNLKPTQVNFTIQPASGTPAPEKTTPAPRSAAGVKGMKSTPKGKSR